METNFNVSLVSIMNYIGDMKRCLVEGEAVLKAKHIICCGIRKKDSESTTIVSLCLQTSSVLGNPHQISTEIFRNGEFDITCTCKAGLSKKCKHCIAVLLYINQSSIDCLEELTCTDVTQEWGKNKTSNSKELYLPIAMSDFCHVNCYNKAKRLITGETKNTFLDILLSAAPNSALALHKKGRVKSTSNRETLKEIVNKGMAENENSVRDTDLTVDSSVEDLLLKSLLTHAENNNILVENISKEPLFWKNENVVGTKLTSRVVPVHLYDLTEKESNFYFRHVHVNSDAALNICKDTLLQSKCNSWVLNRKKRITGSTSYHLFTYPSNASEAEWTQKIERHFKSFSFKGNSNTMYGNVHEPIAREIYARKTNTVVHSVGMIINPNAPWLGFSPDGVVFKDGKPERLVEIKCPVAGENSAVQFLLHNRKIKYMKKNRENYELSTRHQYYGQVQLGMTILNVSVCDFVLFSKAENDVLVFTVHRNEQFLTEYLSKMKFVYFKYILPKLCNAD